MTNLFQVCELFSFIFCGYFFGIEKVYEGVFMFVIGFSLAVYVGELMKNDTIQKEVKQHGIQTTKEAQPNS